MSTTTELLRKTQEIEELRAELALVNEQHAALRKRLMAVIGIAEGAAGPINGRGFSPQVHTNTLRVIMEDL